MLKETEILAFRTKSPKRIAVIYPPYGEIPNEPGIKIVKNNYGVFPSLSLLYVAGAARGHLQNWLSCRGKSGEGRAGVLCRRPSRASTKNLRF